MMAMYALERISRFFTIAFSGGCLLSSVYRFLAGTWPFGVIEAVWCVIALQRFRVLVSALAGTCGGQIGDRDPATITGLLNRQPSAYRACRVDGACSRAPPTNSRVLRPAWGRAESGSYIDVARTHRREFGLDRFANYLHCHNQRSENWLPLVDALRNFVFDPTPDFVALIHRMRAEPLPVLGRFQATAPASARPAGFWYAKTSVGAVDPEGKGR